jgi:pimeloyl-ACP methyl ester carboxylesterase
LADTLVLLPGMMCDARLFAQQIAAFAADRTVLVPPLTGCNTIAAMAQSVLQSAPPQFALAGLSMGGIVAMEIMRCAPERVTHLALIATNPKAEDPAVSANRERQKAQVRQGHLRAVLRDEMKPNYLADSAHKADILDLCMTMAMQLGPEAFLSQSEALASRPDQQDNLKLVTVPSLILCGKEDRLCPLDRHVLLAQLICGARLEIIDGAGHLPTLEQPEATNTALRIWLDGANTARALPHKEIKHV